MSDEKVRTLITADASQATAEWGRFGARVDSVARSMSGALTGVGGVIGGLQSRLIGLGAVIAAGGAIAAGVRQQLTLMDSMSKTAQAAGVSTEKFSSMAYAASLADVSTESLAKAHVKLAGTLVDAQQGQAQAVDLFRRMRLDPKNIEDADALLLKLAERFAAMPPGVERTAAAVDWFGERLGPGLVPFLAQGADGITALREEAARLGVVVSTEAGRASEEFNDTLTRVHQRTQGMQQQIAAELLPTLQALAGAFLEVSRQGGAVNAIGQGIRVTFEAVTVLGANVAYVFDSIGRDIGGLLAKMQLIAEVMSATPGQYMATAKSALQRWAFLSEAVKADTKRAAEELASFERRVMGLGGPGAGQGAASGAAPGAPFVPLPKKPPAAGGAATAAAPSMMAYYEAALEEQRHFAAQSDALHGMTKEKELEFWRSILADTATTAAERVAIARKTSALEVAILTDKAKETQALDGITLASMRDAALARVDLDEQTAQTQAALGRTTQAQLLAQELQFETARAAIKTAALSAQAARLDPDRDVVAIAQINAQIQTLELAHQQRMATIRGQAQIQSANQISATWQDAGQRISGLWDKGVNAMMNGTFTWRNATKAVGAELVGWFSGIVKRQVADWLFGESAKTGATAMGTAARWTMEALAAAKSVALWAATAVKNIMTSAWEAMAGAWKAIVGIPYVGPALAVAAAGAAFAGVAAIASHVSAAGGYDIPSGVNPMVQTHAQEMILPATLASTVRDMATVYSQVRGGQGGGGGDMNISLRGASAGDFFLLHKSELVKAMKAARRDGHF